MDQVQGGHSFFRCLLLAYRGSSVRNDELMKAVVRTVATTRSHWIIACDANIEPFNFQFGDWHNEAKAQVVGALADGVSTNHAEGGCGTGVSEV